VIEGTFQGTIYEESNSSKTAEVTNGRFRVQL